MSTALNEQRPFPTRAEAWRLDPATSTFEVAVKHRLGPISVVRRFRRLEALLRHDSAGEMHIGFAIDTASLELANEPGDPRSRSHRFPDVDAGPDTRFESTRVTHLGAGRFHVTGQLAVGPRRVPVEFEVCLTTTQGSLRVKATALVDHRRLGMTWIPAGPLKAPTELIIRGRLLPFTERDAPNQPAVARAQKPSAVNSRYRFMGA